MSWVELCVGGRTFHALPSTLKAYPEGLLARTLVHSTPPLLFDRNPELFACILEFYRQNVLHLPDGHTPQALQHELEFWGLASLFPPPQRPLHHAWEVHQYLTTCRTMGVLNTITLRAKTRGWAHCVICCSRKSWITGALPFIEGLLQQWGVQTSTTHLPPCAPEVAFDENSSWVCEEGPSPQPLLTQQFASHITQWTATFPLMGCTWELRLSSNDQQQVLVALQIVTPEWERQVELQPDFALHLTLNHSHLYHCKPRHNFGWSIEKQQNSSPCVAPIYHIELRTMVIHEQAMLNVPVALPRTLSLRWNSS